MTKLCENMNLHKTSSVFLLFLSEYSHNIILPTKDQPKTKSTTTEEVVSNICCRWFVLALGFQKKETFLFKIWVLSYPDFIPLGWMIRSELLQVSLFVFISVCNLSALAFWPLIFRFEPLDCPVCCLICSNMVSHDSYLENARKTNMLTCNVCMCTRYKSPCWIFISFGSNTFKRHQFWSVFDLDLRRPKLTLQTMAGSPILIYTYIFIALSLFW